MCVKISRNMSRLENLFKFQRVTLTISFHNQHTRQGTTSKLQSLIPSTNPTTNKSNNKLVSITTKMSATIILAVPVGYGNWPPAAGLANLTQAQRDSYTRRLTCMYPIRLYFCCQMRRSCSSTRDEYLLSFPCLLSHRALSVVAYWELKYDTR
jgi:hypothetical protein